MSGVISCLTGASRFISISHIISIQLGYFGILFRTSFWQTWGLSDHLSPIQIHFYANFYVDVVMLCREKKMIDCHFHMYHH